MFRFTKKIRGKKRKIINFFTVLRDCDQLLFIASDCPYESESKKKSKHK